MKFLKYASFTIAFLIIVGIAGYQLFLKPPPPPITEEDRALIKLMPLPAELIIHDTPIDLSVGIAYSLKDDRVSKAIKRLMKMHALSNDPSGIKLSISYENATEQYPSIQSDESYEIEVGKSIAITSRSEWGALHALETISQLIVNKELPSVSIQDQPRFPWRGILIDAGRHWMPKSVILETLDNMAAAKMNVLHWHLSEYQGFRVESKVFPKLHELGSLGDYYTQKDISEIIEYAADRAIRIVPEFDVPGHATSWFAGYPELASAPGPYMVDTVSIGIFKPIMDPTREEVYEFLDNFFGEMAELFPDQYMHIGGDEANMEHWEENPDIQQFIRDNELLDGHGLQAYFNRRIQKILTDQGKIMAGWDEIIHPELPKEGILVQSWRSQHSLWAAAKKGNSAILSVGWYLDHKRSSAEHYAVEPFVIPGGVTVEIDTTNWKQYELKITFNENEMDGTLYLFGTGDNLRGVIDMLESKTSFESAQLTGNQLQFDIPSQFGTVSWSLAINESNITGEASLSIVSLDIDGHQVGGNNMPGTYAPNFEKIEPLSVDQEQLVLGGEACMWTEMVDSITVSSRVWPRAAVIGERLWSSKEIANDESDMYRRLIVFDKYLIQRGSQHYELINELAASKTNLQRPFMTLVELLQEDRMFNRMMIYPNNVITRSTKLDRLVDMARSESIKAYQFGQLVSKWKSTGNADFKNQLIDQLEYWIDTQTQLAESFNKRLTIQEAQIHSQNLLNLSIIGLKVLSGSSTQMDKEKGLALARTASEPNSAVLLSVAPHFQTLFEYSNSSN
ncbi:MAG: family 20 glycosylhydrolase [Cyclobacteriaceae bacterium]